MSEKLQALKDHLEEQGEPVDLDDIEESQHDDSTFKVWRRDYLVLTDDEADARALEYVRESLWAFNADFLASYCDLPAEMFSVLSEKCESANETIKKLVEQSGGVKEFADEAVSADGRGHFLSGYDGDEYEQSEYFIYRTN